MNRLTLKLLDEAPAFVRAGREDQRVMLVSCEGEAIGYIARDDTRWMHGWSYYTMDEKWRGEERTRREAEMNLHMFSNHNPNSKKAPE